MSTPTPIPEFTTAQILEVLKEKFGFDAFNLGQHEVIEDCLAGHPTVAVMPTGAGKSLCYQLPALLLDGLTVVVSPLISLMKDQVDSLSNRGIGAGFINSSQSLEEQAQILEDAKQGTIDLLYVAPERFRSHRFNRTLKTLDISLFAIDEAHCISRWGHDFRPDYARLGEVVEWLAPERLLACTATATAAVRDDMLAVLRIPDARLHVAGFLRENLYLETALCKSEKERKQHLVKALKQSALSADPIIIYASTRKRVDQFTDCCVELFGRDTVVSYHGGMDDEDRTHAQEEFMSGRARIAVATNAFGMGVDRSDVRAVIHVDLPRSIEGYYQEVGRAGRDGQLSKCLLLFHASDTRVHEFLIELNHANPSVTEGVWAQLKGGPSSIMDLKESLGNGTESQQIESAVRLLERMRAAEYLGHGQWQSAPGTPIEFNGLGIDFQGIAQRRQDELWKLDQVRRFVFHPSCRHGFVLDYFGEELDAAQCPGCDRCCPESASIPRSALGGEPDDVEVTVMRKALAGVARAEGRFGLKKIAGMLSGSKSRAIVETRGLGDLSTYGLLKKLGKERVASLLELLTEQGLCELSGGRYPLLQISRIGWEVMQGRSVPAFRLPENLARPERQAKTPNHASNLSEDESEVVDQLRQFRIQEASENKVPPYVIFNDRTLHALAEALPTDRETFEAVHGLGPGKWNKFGEKLLSFLAGG